MNNILVSVDLKASIDRCLAQKLTCSDFKNYVLIQFDHDLASFWFADAFIGEDPEDGRYVWVMTEHAGYHVYARDELRCCVEYKEINRLRCGDD